jgi:hypothetical protein
MVQDAEYSNYHRLANYIESDHAAVPHRPAKIQFDGA